MLFPRLLSLAALACLVFAADEKKTQPVYEMTTYAVGILRKGPSWTAADTPETRRMQASHMANIQKMAATGKLIVAGPATGGVSRWGGGGPGAPRCAQCCVVKSGSAHIVLHGILTCGLGSGISWSSACSGCSVSPGPIAIDDSDETRQPLSRTPSTIGNTLSCTGTC